MSVLEVVRAKCTKGEGDQFGAGLVKDLATPAGDPTCLAISVLRRTEDRDEFLLLLSWASVQAHEEWRSAHRDRDRPHISHLLEGRPELLGHFELVEHIKGSGADA